MRHVVLLLLLTLSLHGAASFEAAQEAAARQSYEEVVVLLSDVLAATDLEPGRRVAALANRGIAYSLLHRYSEAQRDLHQALELDARHALSMNHLGLLSEHVDNDVVAAAAWYRRAAREDFAPAKVNLGRLSESGSGVRRNPDRAEKLYAQAAESGYLPAYVPYARMLLGHEPDRDREALAARYLLQAAAAGEADADLELGRCYQSGKGVMRDAGKAADYYRRAADSGNADAQNALGFLYRRGLGVAQDYAAAADWFSRAAGQGHGQAANRLAWLLATCPQADVCDGEAAVNLAEALARDVNSASVLDSLAAAYARVGAYDHAVQTIERLLEQYPSQASRYAGRLERYRNNKPYQL